MIELLLQADRLLNVDLVDQAEATYRRVAQQDPRNAMALVGLARCALARGEDREAYLLAHQAHTLDPDDDMARRMEARLAEVLTYRGERLPSTPQPSGAARSTSADSPNQPSRGWRTLFRGPK